MTTRVTEDTGQMVATPLACHVYGVRRADAAQLPPGLTGIDGTAVRLVTHGDLAAVVADARTDRSRWAGADLLAYDDVVDRLSATGAVVPVRFGTVLMDDGSVIDELLVAEETRLVALLDRFSGRAQFKLDISYREDVALAEIVAGSPEIARLRELTRSLPEDSAPLERMRLGQLVAEAMEDKRATDTEALLSSVLPFVDAHAVQPASGLQHIADCALLVADEQLHALEEHLEALAAAVHLRIRLQLRGPMAPYDFVGAV